MNRPVTGGPYVVPERLRPTKHCFIVETFVLHQGRASRKCSRDSSHNRTRTMSRLYKSGSSLTARDMFSVNKGGTAGRFGGHIFLLAF